MAPQTIYDSKHWKKFRRGLLEDKNCTCFLCGKKKWKWLVRKKEWKSTGRFEVHHLHYNTVGHETEKDVRVLCHSCHELITEIQHRRPDSPFIRELQTICTNYIKEDGL
jgi:5-methylcytosine-specific restriction endonuclease McrA